MAQDVIYHADTQRYEYIDRDPTEEEIRTTLREVAREVLQIVNPDTITLAECPQAVAAVVRFLQTHLPE